MNKSILSIVACMMMGAGGVPAQVANWARIVSTPHIVATVSSETGVPVVDVTYDGGGKTPGTAFFSAAFRVPPASRSDGISFEVRGDGSTSYASIFFASQSSLSTRRTGRRSRCAGIRSSKATSPGTRGSSTTTARRRSTLPSSA